MLKFCQVEGKLQRMPGRCFSSRSICLSPLVPSFPRAMASSLPRPVTRRHRLLPVFSSAPGLYVAPGDTEGEALARRLEEGFDLERRLCASCGATSHCLRAVRRCVYNVSSRIVSTQRRRRRRYYHDDCSSDTKTKRRGLILSLSRRRRTRKQPQSRPPTLTLTLTRRTPRASCSGPPKSHSFSCVLPSLAA